MYTNLLLIINICRLVPHYFSQERFDCWAPTEKERTPLAIEAIVGSHATECKRCPSRVEAANAYLINKNIDSANKENGENLNSK